MEALRILPRRRLLYESLSIHLLSFWCIGVLSGQMPLFQALVNNTPEWYAVRLGRSLGTVVVVLAWARWRDMAWQRLGLGQRFFWRNFAVAAGCVIAVWLGVVAIRGTPLWAPEPVSAAARGLAVVVAAVNVVAQQLPTFGLLQGYGARFWKPVAAFGLAWCSYTLSHLIGSPLPMVLVAAIIGLLLGVLLQRTGSLGAGLGVHFGFYLMLAILGWDA